MPNDPQPSTDSPPEPPPLTSAGVWQILGEVTDPEIPVISLVDLGLIRGVGVADERVIVTLTPTFAGCPALQVMRAEIEERLLAAGAATVDVRLVNAPAWTSDWITPRGRQRLAEFGLSPPPLHGGRLEAALAAPAICPYCGSENTRLKNDFGSTLCRAIHVCDTCRQPFEAFKPI